MVAERIVEIQEAFKDKITIEEMVEIYNSLLKDAEGEARDVAASKLQAFCSALPEAGRKEAISSARFWINRKFCFLDIK
ncbi:unnamed protein product [Bursaphelenchus okinawaensis]|uniref:Phosphatase PP2A regulatory subunit A/Splicing factor 3B subunit 1-like HEAT repeat domain-containing protein n=1 Tax=Bursaphelenchus okinawaensis TaxID=465554 RepID=A0A811LJ23_9BILA|nr:unnamed protein product [Bursaphelenchus okinawaensis]CAG9123291.1 unnamed protein product [Bursaphelenchus okinawaensis]